MACAFLRVCCWLHLDRLLAIHFSVVRAYSHVCVCVCVWCRFFHLSFNAILALCLRLCVYWNECLLFITFSSHYNCTHQTKAKNKPKQNENRMKKTTTLVKGNDVYRGACVCFFFVFADWLSFLFLFSFKSKFTFLVISPQNSGKFKLANHALILHEQFFDDGV